MGLRSLSDWWCLVGRRGYDREVVDRKDGAGDAWASQSQIHQASGMIIAQVGVRAEDALALLRGQAFAHGTSMVEVARQIVERRINFRNFTIEGD